MVTIYLLRWQYIVLQYISSVIGTEMTELKTIFTWSRRFSVTKPHWNYGIMIIECRKIRNPVRMNVCSASNFSKKIVSMQTFPTKIRPWNPTSVWRQNKCTVWQFRLNPFLRHYDFELCVYQFTCSALAWSCAPNQIHDDVIKWKHFPRYWPFVRGIHRSPVNSPHKGQWRRALMYSLIRAWINGWVNNREAGDLRRYCDHYDVIVMLLRLVIHDG